MVATPNIYSLYIDKGIKNGKTDNIELTAAPPAIVATTAGRTQHSKVPEDVNSVKRLRALSFILMIFHILLFAIQYLKDLNKF